MKYKFTLLFLLFTTLCIAQQDNIILKIDNYLNDLSKNKDFHLSIAIQKDDSIIYKKAFGYANRAHKIPNTINTKFNIASIGKMFTAVEILKLKQSGKLKLNKTVGTYIPNFPHKGIRDSITIKELLTHSSGLPLWFNKAFEAKSKFQYNELKDYLPLFENVEIDYSKKGKNAYSNVGFFVLGYVIEFITKQSYSNSIKKDIILPNKLLNTGVWNLSHIIEGAATGYTRPTRKENYWRTNYLINMSGSPAGGFHSSVIDLLKFYDALKNNQLLDEKHKELMFQPHINTTYGHYGYGIGISENNKQKIIGHLGGFYGIRGELMWYKDAGYTVAILSNTDQTDYADISYKIKVLLTGTKNEKIAHEFTSQLIEDLELCIIDYDLITSNDNVIIDGFYDENLIQIKAYNFINNREYEKAQTLLKINNFLFPNSKRANFDLEKVKTLIKSSNQKLKN